MTTIETQKDRALTDKNGQPLDIPFGGSLALLAWGDVGYQAWKKMQLQLKKSNDEKQK